MKFLLFCFIFVCSLPLWASGPMLYLYHPPETSSDNRYQYHWEILKLSLDATRKKYGPYEMRPGIRMTEDRQLKELKSQSGKLTVMIRETSYEYESELEPVRIPIDKGLIGYRIYLIRDCDLEIFKNIKTLEDLKKIPVRQGQGWGDVEILERAGFRVLTEVNYDKLFEILAHSHQTSAFPRGVTEILEEYKARKDKLPNLKIEDSIVLYYPLPTYFWFAKNAEGRKLARRVREGMALLHANGKFDETFEKYYGPLAKKLNLKNRKLFKIPNPFLPDTIPFDDKTLWFDPLKS